MYVNRNKTVRPLWELMCVCVCSLLENMANGHVDALLALCNVALLQEDERGNHGQLCRVGHL